MAVLFVSLISITPALHMYMLDRYEYVILSIPSLPYLD